MALYRNWISYAGTGIAAVGVLVFAVLMAYHTIGGGALVQPYGDLVIFFVPPVFVFVGVAVILSACMLSGSGGGCTSRWRSRAIPSGTSTSRARGRRCWLSAIGAAIISVPAIYGSGQAYLYTDAVPFCGAVCHSMTPEYVTYQRIAARPRGLRAVPCRTRRHRIPRIEDSRHDGTRRDHPERLSAADSRARNRVAPHTGQLREVPLAGQFLRLARSCAACTSCPTSRTRAGKSTCWSESAAAALPTNPAMGIHWHVAEQGRVCRQRRRHGRTIPWVRAVDPKTGAAKVYTSPAQRLHASPGRRDPNHGLRGLSQPPQPHPASRQTEAWMWRLPMDASILSSVYQAAERGGAGGDLHQPRTGHAGNRQRAARLLSENLSSGLCGQAARRSRPPIASSQNNLRPLLFPVDEGPLGHIFTNDTHFYSAGCFRCHDGQHKSVDGSVIRSDCNTCHTILRQGKTGTVQFATGPQGLTFKHPVDIGGRWAQQACSSCHTGGSL